MKSKKLFDWYKIHGRHHLPWRAKDLTPYHVWISEIMLQQTQVNRVIDYFNTFVEKYPTVQDLAISDWETFLPYYQGLGYYNRGRNMLKTAQIIVEKYNGVFPENSKELLSLPGIGPYTASAILSFGYGHDVLAFDTNLQKVLGRYLHGDRKAKIDVEKVETYLKSSPHPSPLEKEEGASSPPPFHKRGRGDFPTINGAVMDLSSLICKNKKPLCEQCPLQDECTYHKTSGKLEFQAIQKKNKVRNKNFCSQQLLPKKIILTLHQNHKEYYSSHPDQYQPFELPVGIVTRKDIKTYFQKQYDLNLSVRPPHKKEQTKDAMILYINAQILLGDHEFGIFTKDEL